ncbi:MAG TPA: nitrilase-related carbon-nitrogen hydrolase [Verrucomicrobiae bacterium]|nr:nitrilase-related carbon-nitrogen hydrolase [Verrucomicrobiae bacterium]
MNVVALQLDSAWEDKPANFAIVRGLLAKAPPPKGSLVVLPEMFATGFSMNTGAIAEAYGGETENFLAELARQYDVCLVAGAAMRGRDGRARNKALVFSNTGKLLAFYAKMRPFTPGGESEHYVAGEKPVAFRWADCSVCPFVCYDLRFPELFRQAALDHQPELFVVIANWPEKRLQHWVRLLQARAIENQAYVAGVNRVGSDPFYSYPGRSLVVDFNGDILADAGTSQGSTRAALDLAALRKYRQGLPFLADMRNQFPPSLGAVSR